MDVTVPKVGLTVEECEVGEWEVAVGDTVTQGQILVELYADKVDLNIEAPTPGVITQILAETGTTINIGDVLATIDTP